MHIPEKGGLLSRRDWDDDHRDNWWYTDQAEAIKWGVVGGILLIFALWLILGYLHAHRRVKRGLPPMAYHRWLLPRSQRMRFAPQNQFSFYPQHQTPYEMQTYPPPPPAYNNEYPAPPQYEPPQGASKTNPDQQFPPPSGPPPGQQAAEESSSVGQSFGVNSVRDPSREQGNNGSSQYEQAQLPARPAPSTRSWNPLKRLKG
ncbi:MAG: hypothetical protein LQ342_002562 [Letrouitia transgressa]|nr:MAG: hypothetical protein LQ342_002562 [Letrouitia transgressa]